MGGVGWDGITSRGTEDARYFFTVDSTVWDRIASGGDKNAQSILAVGDAVQDRIT